MYVATVIVAFCVLGGIVINVIIDVMVERERLRNLDDQALEQEIDDIRRQSAELAANILQQWNRLCAVKQEIAEKIAKSRPIIDFLHRLEKLAASTSTSAQNIIDIKKEVADYMRRTKVKAPFMVSLIRNLAKLVAERERRRNAIDS